MMLRRAATSLSRLLGHSIRTVASVGKAPFRFQHKVTSLPLAGKMNKNGEDAHYCNE